MIAKPAIRRTRTLSLAALLVCFTGLTFAQGPANQEHWVPTWGTAQLLLRVAPPQAPQPPPQATAVPPTPVPGGLQTVNNQTVRMIMRTSIGGNRARLKLSNAFGVSAVRIGATHLAKRSQGSSIVAESDRPITFGGKASVRIAPGGVVVSDPVSLDIPPLTDLAVSLYLPEDTGPPTVHSAALRTTYVSTEGDLTGSAEFREARTTTSYYWLSSIEVMAPPETAAACPDTR